MTAEIPHNSPERKEILDDNARKFITAPLDSAFLTALGATSYVMTVDWLEKGSDNEKKLAYKQFENGDVQILLIAKLTENGNRTSVKEKLTEDEYTKLATSSVLHLEKKRHEFEYIQNDIPFAVKYDEYTDGKPFMLEVDAASNDAREAFDPDQFPSELQEVTGDIRYYGYRIAEV